MFMFDRNTLTQLRLTAVVFACLGTQPAHSALVAQYDASVHSNPTTGTGWFTWEATSSIDYQAIIDGGAPAWRISDSIPGPYNYLGVGSPDSLSTNGWRFSMQVRVTSSFAAGPNYNSFGSVTVGFGAGTSYEMVLGLDANGNTQLRSPIAGYTYPDGVPNLGPLFNISGGSNDYHWFEMIFGGLGDPLGVRLYADGQLLTTNLPGVGVAPSADRAYWGNGSVQGHGGANYRFVEFVTGPNLTPIGVPEPSAIVLLSLGSAPLLLRRRRASTH
jgi:hypothetical protein